MMQDVWYLLVNDRGDPAFEDIGAFFVTVSTEAKVAHLMKKVWEENQRIIGGVAAQLKVFSNKDDVAEPTKALKVSGLVGERGGSEDMPLFVVVPKAETSQPIVFTDPKLTFEDLLRTVPTACGKRNISTANTKGTLPVYPRSSENFSVWTTFNQEVYDFSQSELTPYLKLESEITINQMKVFQRAADAGCESDIESSLEYTTFGILVELLRLMGVDSSFSRGKGDSSVILEPDYIWKVLVENRKQAHFRLPVELKDSKAKSGSTESVTVRGVNQMYGYSSFNYSRYAALTTQHELHCFKRSGIPSSVKISNPIPLAGVTYLDHHVSYMTCWLFLLWSARENGIYASPAGSPSTTILPDHKSLPLRPINAPIRGLYELRAINANQIHFTQTLTVAKGAVGTVVAGDLHNHPGLKFKLYDAYHDSRYVEISMKEVAMYKTLESLQGMVIPRFYGYFNYHGIILIAMEDCGSPLTVEEYSLYETRAGNCITALQKLGIYHQDLEARDGKYPNILKSQCGTKIRIVDFHL